MRGSIWIGLACGGSSLLILVAGQMSAREAPRWTEFHPMVAISGKVPSLPGDDAVALASGRVSFRANEYPRIGTPNAARIIAVMFDYTCPSCRSSHPYIIEAVNQSEGSMAAALIPTPLDPACNAGVTRLMPEHADAYLYAKLAMAVWIAAPGKFVEYDSFLMGGSSDKAPDVGMARKRASEIIGVANLDRLLTDGTCMERIRKAGDMYRAVNAGALPKILLSDGLYEGAVGSVSEAVRLCSGRK